MLVYNAIPTTIGAATPSFAIDDVTITEGDTGTTNAVFTVTKTGDNGATSTVGYATADNTAAAGTDYTANSGTLTFLSGGALTQTVSVPVTGDYNIESNETFFVNLTAGTNAAISDNQGLGTITNDDAAGTVVFSPASYSAAENVAGGVLTFNVTRTGGLGSGVTVTATPANGTANGGATCAAGIDFINTPTVVMFSGGQASQTFNVTICNDSVFENDESFSVGLSAPTGGLAVGSPATATATITNDDSAPFYSINNVSQNEGNSGTSNFVFTVTKIGASDVNTSINYQTSDVTATAGSDYTAATGTLTFLPADTTKTITVSVNGDTVFEPNEDFFVTLGTNTKGVEVNQGASNNGVGTIINDDAQPVLSINDVTQNEGNSGTTTFTFTVSLNAPATAGGVTFDIATADDTATAGSDYTAKTLTGQTIPAGSSTYTFDVLVNGDTTVEQTEDFFVNVTNVTGATVGDGQGLGTITNDDAVTPTVSLSIAPTSGSETAQTTITATVTATSAVSGNQTVKFELFGGTAGSADFTATPGIITILSGQTTGTATFSVVDDAIAEGPETATFVISNPSAGITLGSPTSADVTITDNDDLTAPTIDYTPLANTTSTLNANIEVTITDNTGVPTTGSFVPRVYYRKNAAATYISNACVFSNGNTYNCTIDYSLVGNVGNGDSITYFVVAQDTSGNLSSNPFGASGSSVNNLTTAPSAPNYYNIGLNSTVPGGTYSNLNTGSATLAGDVTVTNQLTINGIVNNGAFTLTIDPFADAVRTSGYVIGNVRKVFGLPPLRSNDGDNGVGNPTFTYPVGTANAYSPVTASVTSFTGGSSLSVFAKQGTQPNLSSTTTLQRYWTLAETGNLTANLEFTYLDPLDIRGTESNYRIIRVENGLANFYPLESSTINTTGNTFTASNVSDFSDWTLGESLLSPTAANAEISGRVINMRNRGLENVTVTLSGGSLVEPISVSTNAVGRYRFSEIPAGETYILTVSAKRHVFNQPSTAFTVNGDLTNVNFVGNGW